MTLACALSVTTMLAAASGDADVHLGALLDDVVAHNPSVVAAQQRAVAAARRVDAAGAWSDPFLAIGPDEYTLGLDPPMLRYQLSQAIPLPGKLDPRVDAARARQSAAELAVAVEQRRATVVALQLFLRGVWIDRALAANVAQRGLIDDVIKSAEARYQTGALSAHHDVLLAAAERATLQRDAIALERQRADVLAQLDELRGATPDDTSARRGLVDDNADATQALPASFDDAAQAQPELLLAQAGLDDAGARTRAAEVAALPDVVVQGMAMQSFMPDQPSTIGAMIGVSVPLLYPWKQAPEAEAARADRSAVEEGRRALLLRLRAEWEEARRAEKTAADTLTLYRQDIAPATTAALDSSKAQYATQGAPLVELLSILRAQAAIELEATAAALDVRLAQARVRWLLSSPPLLALAPSSPTLFSPAMGSSSMGSGMGRGSSSSMGSSIGRSMGATSLGQGIAPSADGGGGAMGGMGGM